MQPALDQRRLTSAAPVVRHRGGVCQMSDPSLDEQSRCGGGPAVDRGEVQNGALDRGHRRVEWHRFDQLVPRQTMAGQQNRGELLDIWRRLQDLDGRRTLWRHLRQVPLEGGQEVDLGRPGLLQRGREAFEARRWHQLQPRPNASGCVTLCNAWHLLYVAGEQAVHGVVEVKLGTLWRTGAPGRPEPLDRETRHALKPPQHELTRDPLQRHRRLVRCHREPGYVSGVCAWSSCSRPGGRRGRKKSRGGLGSSQEGFSCANSVNGSGQHPCAAQATRSSQPASIAARRVLLMTFKLAIFCSVSASLAAARACSPAGLRPWRWVPASSKPATSSRVNPSRCAVLITRSNVTAFSG